MPDERPLVLSIAGYDPTGGAGVLADIKTLEQFRVQGMAVLTAHTLQTADALMDITWYRLPTVIKAVSTLMSAYAFPVVKIGIVPDSEFLDAILQVVRQYNPEAFIIWDPVIRSSSGFRFFREESLQELSPLLDMIQLLTPNYPEYKLLQHYGLFDPAYEKQGAVLLKGGHRNDRTGTDILMERESCTVFPPWNTALHPKHGSGCILSAAIAGRMAWGAPLHDAIRSAKNYVERVLNSNTSLLGYHCL